MGTPTLVSFDIENGDSVIKAMDDDGKAPNVALWAWLPDYEDWRLVLASDHLDQNSLRTGYSQIIEAMDKASIPMHRRPTLLMKPMNDPMIQDLRRAFSSAADTRGMRLGGQKFGDKYLEDGVVYRIK
jgi:hypothetical protein